MRITVSAQRMVSGGGRLASGCLRSLAADACGELSRFCRSGD